MRHRVSGRKLGRTSSHRKALLRNLATALFEHERIVTTLPKAKTLRPIVEKLITQGKKGTLHARRKVLSFINKKEIAHKVVDEIAPRFADRPGGYTRIIKLGYRDGDKAEMAIIELISAEESVEKKEVKKEKVRKEIEAPEVKEKAKKTEEEKVEDTTEEAAVDEKSKENEIEKGKGEEKEKEERTEKVDKKEKKVNKQEKEKKGKKEKAEGSSKE